MANVVLLYAPLRTEVDISQLSSQSLAAGRSVYATRSDDLGYPLVFRRVTHSLEVPPGDERSQSGWPLGADDLRCVAIIVPGLGFATNGSRIGRGGGHYDRALISEPIRGRGYRIGVAFDVQLTDDLPTGPLDVPMHAIVTATRTYFTAVPLASTA